MLHIVYPYTCIRVRVHRDADGGRLRAHLLPRCRSRGIERKRNRACTWLHLYPPSRNNRSRDDNENDEPASPTSPLPSLVILFFFFFLPLPFLLPSVHVPYTFEARRSFLTSGTVGIAPIDGDKDVLFVRTPSAHGTGEKRGIPLCIDLHVRTLGQWSSVFLTCSDVTRGQFSPAGPLNFPCASILKVGASQL